MKAEYDRLVTVTPDGPEKFIPMGDLADEVLSLAPVREMDSWLTDLEGGRAARGPRRTGRRRGQGDRNDV